MKQTSELKEKLAKLLPCIQHGCDQNGTIPEEDSQGGWQPAQCEFCYKIRFPFLEETEKLLSQYEVDIRADELREIQDNLPQEQEENPLLNKDKEMWGYGQYHMRNRILSFLRNKELEALSQEKK